MASASSRAVCGGDLIPRNVFAIEHDVGLEDTAAGGTWRYGERRKIHLAEVGVTIWKRRGVKLGPSSVEAD
jgi:hypothetical protein